MAVGWSYLLGAHWVWLIGVAKKPMSCIEWQRQILNIRRYMELTETPEFVLTGNNLRMRAR